MLIKTHLAITCFIILLLLPFVSAKWIFVCFALVATYLPDLDSRYSSMGHKTAARFLQFFTRHRGIIHSFSFLFLVTLVLVLFFPVVSLGFFVGYSSHLFADSFTIEGIRPFYPMKRVSNGKLATGGALEKGVFSVFLIADLVLVWVLLFSLI